MTPRRNRKTGIDPILFRYEPHTLPPRLAHLVKIGRGESALARKLVDGWTLNLAVQRDYVKLARGGSEGHIADQVGQMYGLSRTGVYQRLRRVAAQLHWEHPDR